VAGAMGDHLNRAYGSNYVNLGFLFGRGGLNAVGGGRLQAWTAQLVPAFSMESVFLATGQPRLLLDTRTVEAGGPAARPLNGPLWMRSIGAVFDPASENVFYQNHTFPREYDLVMYVAQTTPSVLLPFVR
jgi:erythromycin esterase-like protein